MSSRPSVEDLIDRYLTEIEYLSDQPDLDMIDRAVLSIYSDVIHDLQEVQKHVG